MRMNKKLKNVLAFGLATSFVLTSTMGVSATVLSGILSGPKPYHFQSN